jgi:hypothetical protein
MRVQVVSEPTVISTFAGCGGSSLGYKLAGFKELLAVEWDQNAVDTFRLNFPEVPVYHGDIAKLTGAECMRLAGIKVGELDVFDGSPPCQGFSTAGKRKFDDPRKVGSGLSLSECGKTWGLSQATRSRRRGRLRFGRRLPELKAGETRRKCRNIITNHGRKRSRANVLEHVKTRKN